MRAEKENRVYTISNNQVSDYQSRGFDVYNDDGNIVVYGKGKTVLYEDYMSLQSENDALKTQIKMLQEQLQLSNSEDSVESKAVGKGKKAGA